MAVTLSLDAMGGDQGAEMVLGAVELSLQKNPNTNFMVFGLEDELRKIVDNSKVLSSHLGRNLAIIHAAEVVTNETKPTAALRLRDSSMRQAINAVCNEQAHAVVSAGNTGAYMALSKILFKTLNGIERPAIPAVIPALNKSIIMLDLGANIECSEDNLVQFALMGEEFSTQLLGVKKPSIGLLNVGKEEGKGLSVLHKAFEMLKNIPSINFYGFVEGDDIGKGTVDVVVTDGFTGNISLKTLEGTANLIRKVLTISLQQSWRTKLGYLIAKPAFEQFKNQFDPRLFNGAVFLGLQKIAVKSHGGTDKIGFANAIEVAITMAQHNFTQHVQERVNILQKSHNSNPLQNIAQI